MKPALSLLARVPRLRIWWPRLIPALLIACLPLVAQPLVTWTASPSASPTTQTVTYNVLTQPVLCTSATASGWATVATAITALTYTFSPALSSGNYCVGVQASQNGATSVVFPCSPAIAGATQGGCNWTAAPLPGVESIQALLLGPTSVGFACSSLVCPQPLGIVGSNGSSGTLTIGVQDYWSSGLAQTSAGIAIPWANPHPGIYWCGGTCYEGILRPVVVTGDSGAGLTLSGYARAVYNIGRGDPAQAMFGPTLTGAYLIASATYAAGQFTGVTQLWNGREAQ